MQWKWPIGIVTVVFALLAVAAVVPGRHRMSDTKIHAPFPTFEKSPPSGEGIETATFGAGCFWCVEAVFQQIEGVKSVTSGYTGGLVPNPTYEQISTGATGHAEVVQITYDPRAISFAELLEAFWRTHDPTTLDRQGSDTGTQYRSAVFYHSEQQRELAEHYKVAIDASGAFNRPLVTEIVPASEFYSAEGYHQNYYQDNPRQPYCAYVIGPKLDKFREVFAEKLKPVVQ